MDKVDGQNEKKTRGMQLMTVGAVQDSSGRRIKISSTRPIPHMIDVEGKFIVGMP